jgi:hypothetical protein
MYKKAFKTRGLGSLKLFLGIRLERHCAAVGALLYLMLCTRPDLAFALSRLSRFSSKPGEKHAAALKQVLRYLSFTQDMGIAPPLPPLQRIS